MGKKAAQCEVLVLGVLRMCFEEQRLMPTLQELSEAIHFSRSSVSKALDVLEAAGDIKSKFNEGRRVTRAIYFVRMEDHRGSKN